MAPKFANSLAYIFSPSYKLSRANVGLYRDHGLAVVRSESERRLDNLRKEIIQIFKQEGIAITIKTNLKLCYFLDVTLNLQTGKYYPFQNPIARRSISTPNQTTLPQVSSAPKDDRAANI